MHAANRIKCKKAFLVLCKAIVKIKKNIIMERLDQSSLHPFTKHPETGMSRPGFESWSTHRRWALYEYQRAI
jgi:hypothetical protein